MPEAVLWMTIIKPLRTRFGRGKGAKDQDARIGIIYGEECVIDRFHEAKYNIQASKYAKERSMAESNMA